MARNGGARPGAGRPRGTTNQRSAAMALEALGSGQTPAAYLVAVMRDPEADEKRRDWAAEKLAPFVHPRPTPVDRTVQLTLPDTSTIAGIDQALSCIIVAMGAGEISPSEGASFINAIEARRRAIDTADLLKRIEELEALKN